MFSGPRSDTRGGIPAAVADVVAALAVATLLVDVLDEITDAVSLTIVYLLPVLFVAVRRGSGAALTTSAVGVLLFNLLFIDPRFELGISRSEDLVTLLLFFVVSVVVGRLAATARDRSEQADEATSIALAREREARILAQTASSVLAVSDSPDRDPVGAVAEAMPEWSESRIRIAGDRPSAPGLQVIDLGVPSKLAWLAGERSAGWDEPALQRLAGPLSEICSVVEVRNRVQGERASAEAARRADVAKTALLHAVSHDLRSPLTAISTAASAMPQLPDQDHAALLAVIREETDRLSRLVDDLLDVSRIEAGAVEPNRDWCDVNEVAARAAAAVRRLTDHPIELALPSELLMVRADPVQLERVFVNLLDNAVKHSPPGEPVRFSGGTGGGRAHLRVVDQGRGIPLSKRGQVFEPFFRGGGIDGSGLGLTICRGFTQANGGSIRIDDTPGGGTSIGVSFPLVSQPSPA